MASKKHNDFFYFMQEQKPILRQQGISWNSMPELVSLCGPKWAQLSPSEKSKYKAMAKKAKTGTPVDLSLKYTSDGRCLADIQREVDESELELKDMFRTIKQTLKESNEAGSLDRKKFYLIHFNHMCQTFSKSYIPCELAMVEYSLEDGISKALHTFISPEDSKDLVGLGYEMKRIAEKTHCLDRDAEPLKVSGCRNWAAMVNQILAFVDFKPNEKTAPPVYTLEDDVMKVKSCLDYIFDRCPDSNLRQTRNLFKVFHVHQLLFELSYFAPNGFLEEDIIAKKEIETELFTHGVSCAYHDWLDKTQHCSMTLVKRWAFIMTKFIGEKRGNGQMQGRHIPPDEMPNICTKKKYPPITEIHIARWSKIPGENIIPPTMIDRDICNAPKTKALPAGHMDLPSANGDAEIKFIQGSSLASQLYSDNVGRVQLKNIEGAASSRPDSRPRPPPHTGGPDVVDAVPFLPSSGASNACPWGSKKTDHGPSLKDASDFPPLGGGLGRAPPAASEDFPPLGGRGVNVSAGSARGGLGRGRGQGRGDGLAQGMARMKI